MEHLMTGINLTIVKNEVAGQYAILHTVLWGEHQLTFHDRNTTKLKECKGVDKTVVFDEMIDYLKDFGLITNVTENRPDEDLIKMVSDLEYPKNE